MDRNIEMQQAMMVTILLVLSCGQVDKRNYEQVILRLCRQPQS